jgi:hypothetical protein
MRARRRRAPTLDADAASADVADGLMAILTRAFEEERAATDAVGPLPTRGRTRTASSDAARTDAVGRLATKRRMRTRALGPRVRTWTASAWVDARGILGSSVSWRCSGTGSARRMWGPCGTSSEASMDAASTFATPADAT